jgi:hypothetical protein
MKKHGLKQEFVVFMLVSVKNPATWKNTYNLLVDF